MSKNYHAALLAVSRIDPNVILSAVGQSMNSQPVVLLSKVASEKSFQLIRKRVWRAAMYSFENGDYRKLRAASRYSSLARAVQSPKTELCQVLCLKIKFVAPSLKFVFAVPDCDALFI
jgi:hypothetical protein